MWPQVLYFAEMEKTKEEEMVELQQELQNVKRDMDNLDVMGLSTEVKARAYAELHKSCNTIKERMHKLIEEM